MKVWSEDGAGKVVEIPADMTARDMCQLLVYKSHCLDDNAWTLVEHHPILGLGKNISASVLFLIIICFTFCKVGHEVVFCALMQVYIKRRLNEYHLPYQHFSFF